MLIEYYRLQAKQVGSYGAYFATSPLYGDKLKNNIQNLLLNTIDASGAISLLIVVFQVLLQMGC